MAELGYIRPHWVGGMLRGRGVIFCRMMSCAEILRRLVMPLTLRSSTADV